MDNRERALRVIIEHLGCEPAEAVETATLDDLGADSLDVVELEMAFEDEFKIDLPDDLFTVESTVGRVVDAIGDHAGA